MNVKSTFQTRIGGRNENQDYYKFSETNKGKLFVLCDGLGGHLGGRHAAELATETIFKHFKKRQDENVARILENAIEKANMKIWKEGINDERYNSMGTTVVALLITPDSAISCHAGDSRIYQIRNKEIIFRTADESYVFELVKQGKMTEEEARISEMANLIVNFLGFDSEANMNLNILNYEQGDRFLLCSDGLSSPIPEKELIEKISKDQDVDELLSELVEEIDQLGFKRGGNHDNITGILLEIE